MSEESTNPNSDQSNRDNQLVDGAWQQVIAIPPPPDKAAGPTEFRGPPPDSFTGYKIIREIHRGGQGVVYQAIQESTSRKVALKVMMEGPFAGSADQARFEREVQILGQLDHPNIVTIHDSGSAAGHHYFVMDYIPGQPLDVYMASAERTIDDTLKLFGQICDAVNAAHLRGVIHRDLKPGNIRVDTAGEPRVLDFGLAKMALGNVAVSPAEAPAMTMTGQFIGSLPWASPEQAEGVPSKIDLRTDVYALGVILYQMLTARFPYDVTGSMRDALDSILNTEPTSPRTLRKQINDEVETIVLKCLQKERDRRYQAAGELGRDVQHYLRGEPIEAKRDSGWYVLKKSLRRHRIPTAVAAGFVVLITASAVALGFLYREAVEARDQTQIVADFQSSRLAETDVEGMGLAIVNGFEDRIRAVLAKRIEDQGELDQVMHDWRQQTLKAGPTTVALSVLNEFVLDKAVEAIDKDFVDQPLVRAALQQTVAVTYRELGLFESAMPLFEAALAIRRRVLGDDHQDTLTSMAALGLLLTETGDYGDAELYAKEALESSRRVLGNDHPQTLVSINNMGYLLATMSKPADAEPYYREALENRRRVLGNDHPETLGSINNMAYLLQSMNRLDDAGPYWDEALEGYRRVLGDNHPDTLLSINNMGYWLQSMDRLDEAEPYYRDALEGCRRILGDEHPQTLLLINNMGYLLAAKGMLEEAEPYYRRALEGRRRVLGDNDLLTLGSLHNLADLLRDLDQLEEAEKLGAELVRSAEQSLPKGHWYTGIFLTNYGKTLAKLRRHDEAEVELLDAHDILEIALGQQHERTLKVIQSLAELYDAWHAAEPEKGYAAKAAEWRAMLEDDAGDNSNNGEVVLEEESGG